MIVSILLTVAVCSFGQVDMTGKYVPRTNPNLIDFKDSRLPQPDKNAGWKHVLKGQAAWKKKHIDDHVLWNKTHSYDAGTGSFKFSNTGGKKDKVFLDNLVLQGGKSYTISMRCMAPSVKPAPVMLVQVSRKHNGKYINDFNEMFSPAEASKWEEFTFFFELAPTDDSLRIQIINYIQPTKGMKEEVVAYIDDIYLGEGKGFSGMPAEKIPFPGEQVKVDKLGNVEVRKNGKWEPFFPFIIYPDSRRIKMPALGKWKNGWGMYTRQGFNTVISGASNDFVEKAKEAGLYAIPHLGFYYADANNKKAYQNFDLLGKRLDELKRNDLFKNLLFYYIDNEKHGKEKQMQAVTDYVMNWEKSNFKNPQIPIYILNGSSGLAPKYRTAENRRADITGTYIKTKGFATRKFTILDQLENQKMPVVIAQINGSTKPLRVRLYGAIAHGAKGMGYWRDFAPGNSWKKPGSDDYVASRDITKTLWWNNFPNIVEEVKQLMPLIRQPHWTKWEVSCDNEMVDIGTRDYNGKGYVIIANYNAEPVEVCFKVSGLPFTNCPVVDYFSPDKQVTYMTDSSFTIRIPGHGAGVYCLNKNTRN